MRGKLKLRAVTAEDLRLVSACLQDALVTVSDMNWFGAQLRFAVLANRFRWEAALEEGSYERTHALPSAAGALIPAGPTGYSICWPSPARAARSNSPLRATPRSAWRPRRWIA